MKLRSLTEVEHGFEQIGCLNLHCVPGMLHETAAARFSLVGEADVCANASDQLAVLNRDEKTPLTFSASFTLQAVKLASRLICVALRFVFSVL